MEHGERCAPQKRSAPCLTQRFTADATGAVFTRSDHLSTVSQFETAAFFPTNILTLAQRSGFLDLRRSGSPVRAGGMRKMKKLMILLVGMLLGLAAAPAAAATYSFVLKETTPGAPAFTATFQLSNPDPNCVTSCDFGSGEGIEYYNVDVFFNGSKDPTNSDVVTFDDAPDGGLVFFSGGSFGLSTTAAVSGQQAFRRDSNGNFSGFGGGLALEGDQGDTGRSFTLSISQTVPEPDTWAMMILGFGVAGYALRRKRRRESAADARLELQPAL